MHYDSLQTSWCKSGIKGCTGWFWFLLAAADAGLTLPLADTHRRLMEQAEAAGLGELDNSAIIRVFKMTH